MKVKTNERIRELMDEKYINSVALGNKIGISSQSLNNILRTNNPIRYNNLLKLAQYFNCSIDFICGRTNNSGRYINHTEFLFPTMLKKLISNKNNSLENIANDIKISRLTFYEWLNGSLPLSSSLIALADYFDCTIDYLLGLEN